MPSWLTSIVELFGGECSGVKQLTWLDDIHVALCNQTCANLQNDASDFIRLAPKMSSWVPPLAEPIEGLTEKTIGSGTNEIITLSLVRSR